jgi:N-acyl-D-amino-acid deacylase
MKYLLIFLCFLWSDAVIAFGGQAVIDADIAIINGQIVDGNGGPRYAADIAIRGNRIVFIGSKKKIRAKQRIDARGMIVAPGFIDGHSHTAKYMVSRKNRLNESALTQGVTTIVFGADGDYSPQTLRNMLDRLQQQGMGTNVGFYVGHNGIRQEVMADNQRRNPDEHELNRMKGLVRDGMNMGAVGFSTGLMYDPGSYSETNEIIELSMVVSDFGGIYDSHVRDPARALIASDQEVIDIGLAAGVAAKIAHVKAVCLSNVGNTKTIIDMVEKARERGQNVVSDQYPYDGAKTVFLSDVFLRPPSLPGTDLKELLQRPEQRELIRQASENGINGGFSWLKATGYDCIRITHSQDYPEYEGQYLSEIAQGKNQSGFDIISELVVSARYEIRITLGGVDEQDVRMLLVQPWNMIVSDGKYINEHSSSRQHPRSTGTFARVLGKYVRELNLLTLEQAITKMTSQPADFLGFSDRGRLAVGKIADVVVFNANKIIDQSTWAYPLRYSKGIRHLLVNGEFAVKNGVVSPRAVGIVIKRTHKTSAFIGDKKGRELAEELQNDG